MRLTLELAMPAAVLAAVAIGAVVASAQPAPPQLAEMEGEEIVTQIAVEPEPMVIAAEVVAPPAPRQKVVKQEALGTSKLELDITEGATVWLGKKKLGVAPIEKMEIVEGRYLIRVEMDDTTFAEWVDVPPGGTFAYRLKLSEDAPVEAAPAPETK